MNDASSSHNASHIGAEFRQHPRIKLPAMYTLVRVRPTGYARYCWTGYVYDISQSGMRLELDEALPAGTRVDVRVMLPGHQTTTTFHASGTIIRSHEDDLLIAGPVRMGMTFESFPYLGDERRLIDYIAHAMARPAKAA